MQSAKYETDVDLSNENMSQTLIAQLVGEGRRVLDVGCATGYTAQVLRGLGCTVQGVEYDPAMAEAARPHLDRIEVGDVEAMDLVGLFGEGSVDVVVFGDVLEHLRDPGAVLERCRPLLAPGGSVVASIPNVAHGSVRLALLDGRFEYTETGLLDRTHVRFFTRDAVLALLRGAGYVPVELRRTRLGVFETEVEVREGDYPPGVLADLLRDPEVMTYQFVVRAVPAAAAPAGADEVLEQAEERARALLLEEQARAAGDDTALGDTAPGGRRISLPTAPPARVGLLGAWDLDDLATGLLARTVPAELARRLPGVMVRLLAPHGDARGGRLALGEPVEPLGRLGRVRARALADGLDAALVVGRVETTVDGVAAWYGDPPRRDHPALLLAEGLPDDVPTPVRWGPVRLPGADHHVALPPGERPGNAASPVRLPDPALLAPRVLDRTALAARLPHLRSQSWYPPGGPVVALSGPAALADQVPALADAVARALAGTAAASVVILELEPSAGDAAFAHPLAQAVQGAFPGSVHLCPVEAGLAALLADDAALALRRAYGRPAGHLRHALGSGSVAGVLADQLAHYGVDAARLAAGQAVSDAPPPDEELAADLARLDAWFDEVAAAAREAASAADPARTLDVAARYAALERAHAAMRARTTAELRRLALAAPPPPPDLSHELAKLRAEIEAINNTKVMRALRPAREAYSRVRARRR
ncbi:MAG TPA: class I SAM-dependent methyltransferase [Mycobacteriales bacterium]|nr:class I SAM-dependent methyltransferase [Mycobacteriales bacterium]